MCSLALREQRLKKVKVASSRYIKSMPGAYSVCSEDRTGEGRLHRRSVVWHEFMVIKNAIGCIWSLKAHLSGSTTKMAEIPRKPHILIATSEPQSIA